jgi:hypothetical protein
MEAWTWDGDEHEDSEERGEEILARSVSAKREPGDGLDRTRMRQSQGWSVLDEQLIGLSLHGLQAVVAGT